MAELPRHATSSKAPEVDLSAPRPWLRRVDPGGYGNAYCLGLTAGRAVSPVRDTWGTSSSQESDMSPTTAERG